MALKTYHQKRNFKKTPEPKGKLAKSTSHKNLYVIQKHAASHLHYDFRLELNGVLLSWAVPKGPSLDPTVKRLAMHVEDHPVEYGSFEGIIPKGQYGGGTVMLWDKGEWICESPNPTAAYKKGSLTFQLQGKKLKGEWKLVRMNNNDKTWLLIKIKDEYAKSAKQFDITVAEPNSVLTHQSIDEIAENYKKVWGKSGAIKDSSKPKKKTTKKKIPKIKIDVAESSFPKIIYPQLATLVDKPPTGKNWIHEIKFDGYRLLAFKQGKKVTLLTRNQNDWTHKFKNIAHTISQLPTNNLILDGEIVVLDENQRSNFQLLQNSIKEHAGDIIYYIFDLIYYDKFNLTSLKLTERKNILQQLLLNQDNTILRYSDHVTGSGEKIFAKSCKLGLEGIISKEVDSHYTQERTKHWLKIKCIKRQEFIIAGFNKSDKRKYFRSLLLGTFNDKHELIYNGNVGTGFTENSLLSIYKLLSKHITSSMPFAERPPDSKNAIWIEPVLVAEIEFTEWTESGTLRHPSFKGIRTDKPAKHIIKEVETPMNKITDTTNLKYKLTNSEKILYTEGKITKGQIAEYYDSIHQWILPYMTDRPLTLVRCPDDYNQCFYQKHLDSKNPPGILGTMIKEKSKKEEYLYIKDQEGLMALVQLGVLEIHPWGSRINNVEHPDTIIFDLDPATGLPWKNIVSAAFEIKQILEDYQLKCFVKTTGGKGLHVVVPIKPEYNWKDVKEFSHVLVNYLVLENPKKYIATMTKSKRTNKIFVDYLRNQRGATSIAPYSTRARKHAPVATPLAWDELTNDIRDTFFTIKTLPKRLASLKQDPWKDYFKIKQSLKLDKL
ncbi:MAG: DNA ligase D [Gammaproteobacteria bacterium]